MWVEKDFWVMHRKGPNYGQIQLPSSQPTTYFRRSCLHTGTDKTKPEIAKPGSPSSMVEVLTYSEKISQK